MWIDANNQCIAQSQSKVDLQTTVVVNNSQQNDLSSVQSISSDDISTDEVASNCCNLNATNPAIKKGRQFQLFQVCKKTTTLILE